MMMKKFLSFVLAVCLLLAACPAALASTPYSEVDAAYWIRATVTGGTLKVTVQYRGTEVTTAQIPLSHTLASTRVELSYGQAYDKILTDASNAEIVFNKQDLQTYGLLNDQAAESEMKNKMLQLVYTRNVLNNDRWKKAEYSLDNNENLPFNVDYETLISLHAGEDYYRGAEFMRLGVNTEPAYFRYFITNGPAITGTDYDADAGKWYDLSMKEGAAEDWTFTFQNVSPDELQNASLGDGELVKDVDYTVEASGADAKVTLNGSFLKTLNTNYHKVKFDFVKPGSGAGCQTAVLINVVGESVVPAVPSVPTTGDNTRLVLWSALLCLSAGVAAWLFGRRKYAR